MRLDRLDFAIDHSPVGTQVEAVTDNRFEGIFHEPFLDQVGLGQRAPDLFRGKGNFPFHDNSKGIFVRETHWSILLKRSSRSSNRRSQNTFMR